jgi:acrylyl-CoA reductase (NADPH)
MFKALMLENLDGKVSASVRQVEESQLPAGEVTVAVEYSSLNFKELSPRAGHRFFRHRHRQQ